MNSATRRDFLATMPAALAVAKAQARSASDGQETSIRISVPGMPVFPYGAVYFRKNSPPEQDWARDHKTAAEVGMNTFRHWFLWPGIEVARDQYDWRDYDRMMELAAQNGMKVVIAELTKATPEWMFDDYAHACYRDNNWDAAGSVTGASSGVGGFPGLCFDNEDVRARAEKFLVALVEHYCGHRALLGYDLWNENLYEGGSAQRMYCYCPATQQKFRNWLKAKYGSAAAVGRAWHGYIYPDWRYVHPPRALSGNAESMDWLEFRNDCAIDMLHWRSQLFRKLDPHHLIVAHGVAGTLQQMPTEGTNEWRSAKEVDVWGLTWVASRKGSEPWKQFHAMDLVRAGSRGKPFWHAEAQAGPLWMQPQVIGRPREDGRITEPEDVRIWNLISCATGATGILYPRMRPLLSGPTFGAFGAFAMDGSVTPRAEMAGKVAHWANEHADLWKSRPVKGDIGIVFVSESELFNFAQLHATTQYSQSAEGAYQAFFDSNIQADWVHIDNIGEYKAVYLPYPLMLKPETVKKLVAYVEQGGNLISEGLPAYFGEGGIAGTVQPNYGLDGLFGAKESYVEFTPDLLEKLTLQVRDSEIYGRYFLQAYTLAGGKAVGTYHDGQIAAVEHNSGSGKTLLIGTHPGAGYFLHHSPGSKKFFAGLLEWISVPQQVRVSDPLVKARLHEGAGGMHLWVLNPSRQEREVTVTLLRAMNGGEDLWGNTNLTIRGNDVQLKIGERDAAVIRLT